MHCTRDCVHGCTCVNAGVHRGQNSLRYPRPRIPQSKLTLWTVVSCPKWVMETEFGHSIRAMECLTTGHLLVSVK